MRYRSLILALILVVGGIATAHHAFAAFSVTISPANKVIELERGGSYSYKIGITNNEEAGVEQVFSLRVAEFSYDENGQREFIEPQEIADPTQSMMTWVKVPSVQSTSGNEVGSFSIDIQVPKNARYGDHMALIYVSKQEAAVGAGTPLTIQGRLASVLIIKVIGGEAVRNKTGEASDFQIQVREKARNTATLVHNFRNTSDEFYYVETVAEIFDDVVASEPIKVLKTPFRVFPNVQKNIQFALGDLGDDYGEKDYYLRVKVQEVNTKSTEKLVFGRFEQSFKYYVPLRDDPVVISTTAEKSTSVMPDYLTIVKELGLYVFGFLVILIILIKVLFFNKSTPTKKR